jgi:hypothetical protein
MNISRKTIENDTSFILEAMKKRVQASHPSFLAQHLDLYSCPG